MKFRDQIHAAAMRLIDANIRGGRKVVADLAFLDDIDKVLEAFEASVLSDVAKTRSLGEPVWGDVDNSADPPLTDAERRLLAQVPPPPSMTDAAEMLWVVLANVSGGDWTLQTLEWQEAAARWRDNYFAAVTAAAKLAAACLDAQGRTP